MFNKILKKEILKKLQIFKTSINSSLKMLKIRIKIKLKIKIKSKLKIKMKIKIKTKYRV